LTAVAILGAGLSGVLMGIELRRAGIEDFVVYERAGAAGGTWLHNTYPGLCCDIPSHLYCYSFEPNPDFSSSYAPQPEIRDYIRRAAKKYGVHEHIRFRLPVERGRFDEASGHWDLELGDGGSDRARVLVSATGGLTEPHVPRIEGRERFEGPSWHSGAWRHDVSLEGQRVAVVGSAASAVQVVPEVVKRAREVIVFSRTPNWVTPRNNHRYTDEEKARLRSPEQWRRVRRRQYRQSMLWHRAFVKDPKAIATLRCRVFEQMRAAISDPDLLAALTPDYEPGCKRILVSDDYYPALAKPHVRLVPHGVVAMSETALEASDGRWHEADIVIFCTGYKLGGRADGRPAVEVFGRGGTSLRQALARAPEAYRGVAIPGFPNYFTICGINGAAGHAPVFLSAEACTGFIRRWIEQVIARDLKVVEPSVEATRRYNDAIQRELRGMSWGGDCPGWYRDRQGRVIPFHPGSWCRMRREFRSLHEEEFVLEPRDG